MHRDSCLDPLEHFTQLLNFVIDVVYKLALAAQAVRPVAMVVHVPIHVASRVHRQPPGIAPVCPLTGNVLPAAAAIVRHGMVKESASLYRMNMRVQDEYEGFEPRATRHKWCSSPGGGAICGKQNIICGTDDAI